MFSPDSSLEILLLLVPIVRASCSWVTPLAVLNLINLRRSSNTGPRDSVRGDRQCWFKLTGSEIEQIFLAHSISFVKL